MKQAALSVTVLVLGVVLMLVAVLSRSLVGFRVPASLAMIVFLVGIALQVYAVDGIHGSPLQAHFEAYKRAYSRAVRALSLALAAALVLAGYLLFISVGRWTFWPPTTAYYDQ